MSSSITRMIITRVRANDSQMAFLAEQLLSRYKTLEAVEDAVRRHVVMAAIAGAHGNQCQAAEVLGVHRNTVNRVVKEL